MAGTNKPPINPATGPTKILRGRVVTMNATTKLPTGAPSDLGENRKCEREPSSSRNRNPAAKLGVENIGTEGGI